MIALLQQPIAVELYKFIHLVCVVSFVGLLCISYLLLIPSLYRRPNTRLLFDLRFALFSDQVMLLLSPFLFITGSLLVIPKGYTFKTPWIHAAFVLFTLVLLLISINYFFKRQQYKRLQQSIVLKRSSMLSIHLCYCLSFIVCLGIIHDAVTKYPIW